MKKLFLFGALALLLASCGSTNELTHNLNNHTTRVVLSKKNFNGVEQVKGEASNLYVLGFGGTKAGLVGEARAKMLQNANLVGSSKAVINETVEIHYFSFLLGANYKVVVSADVIEFTE